MLTTDFVPGAPNWIDLGSRDTTAAAAFYASLFGWEFTPAGPEAGGYGMFERDGRPSPRWVRSRTATPRPRGRSTSTRADADATSKAVEQAGGLVRFPADEVFDQGRIAGYTDPGGAEFAVWEPGANKGLDHVGPGGLCWTELFTTDAERGQGVLRRGLLLGPPRTCRCPGSAAGTYTIVSRSGGGQEGSHGDIMQLGADMLPDGTGYWQPYFAVDDVDAIVATATARGGSVMMPATDMAGHRPDGAAQGPRRRLLRGAHPAGRRRAETRTPATPPARAGSRNASAGPSPGR